MNDFQRKNMWDSDYRPEQIIVNNYILDKFPNLTTKMEFKLKLELDGKHYRQCKLDIAIPSKKIGIRLNGGYHFNSNRQETKDEFQKEALRQMGWSVIDLDHYNLPNLFKKKKTLKLIEDELGEYLGFLSYL